MCVCVCVCVCEFLSRITLQKPKRIAWRANASDGHLNVVQKKNPEKFQRHEYDLRKLQ